MVTTDFKRPSESMTTGDARVGAWRDDKHHLGKSDFTYDLTPLKDKQLFTAIVRTPEKAANDCAKPRATRLWLVEPQGAITWTNQPAEISKVDGPNAGQDCVAPRLNWNVAELVENALAQGRTKITFALRIAEEFQGEVGHGRTYDPAAVLATEFNTPPGTPTGLKLDIHDCGSTTPFLSSTQPRVRAIVHDSDGHYGLEGTVRVLAGGRAGAARRVRVAVGRGRNARQLLPRGHGRGRRHVRPGQPIEFVVTPALPGSHEVLWYIAFNTPQVVPVGADGRARFTYASGGSFELTVSSRTPDGIVSGDVRRSYQVPQQ
ncbi:hypothetical protein C8D87_1011323 [Lentzea atacamensis]|uniref:PKD domain-containing protein n=1 Tax=Lentzea atacamensis TaxID=531938 RepID=A0ABX9EMS9_9PSEU|nr:hypothetical protein [Lentzea atacamensis]RAS71022.1 hypothetical protein C8D87_1011323 [Lentzea atacamensis]